jgi:hypothetical protein
MGGAGRVPSSELNPGVCLTTEENHGKPQLGWMWSSVPFLPYYIGFIFARNTPTRTHAQCISLSLSLRHNPYSVHRCTNLRIFLLYIYPVHKWGLPCTPCFNVSCTNFWSRVLLEKLMVTQLFLYGTLIFMIVFSRAMYRCVPYPLYTVTISYIQYFLNWLLLTLLYMFDKLSCVYLCQF